jgi:hypothetical protein
MDRRGMRNGGGSGPARAVLIGVGEGKSLGRDAKCRV